MVRQLRTDLGAVPSGAGSHVVQFYDCDEELVDSVAGYLAHELACGNLALVVATAAHSEAFAARLTAAGVDARAAERDEALVFLDADSAVAQFAGSGTVDAAAFDAVIAQRIRKIAATGREVRIYGEMVALLWEQGHVNAALELETLWNKLSEEIPFALYCAYPGQSVGNIQERAAVCGQHTAVISVPGKGAPQSLQSCQRQVSRGFEPAGSAPRAVRQFVTAMLEEWAGAGLVEDAALVVTEIATNAVVHTQAPFSVTVAASEDTIRIDVADAHPPAGALLAAPGHGLSVVDAVAASWGVHPVDGGKTVWAQLRLN